MVAEALGDNQALESLTTYNDRGLVEAALLRLGSHPRLRELVLEGCSGQPSVTAVNALGYFLHSSTALERLDQQGSPRTDCEGCSLKPFTGKTEAVQLQV